MAKRRHLPEEIAAKLQQAHAMASEGALQTDIARALGISVMTFHRWRRTRPSPADDSETKASELQVAPELAADATPARVSALQLENTRLRRLVTDLLLEKVTLEEALERARRVPGRSNCAKG
jgi:putative transposase